MAELKNSEPDFNLEFIEAVLKDHEMLTETAIASKKSHGYSDDLMSLWKSDLEISKDYIMKNKVFKIYDNNFFIGFFGLKLNEHKIIEIDHLWLLPGRIGKGYGRLIFNYIIGYLKINGHRRAILFAEPKAKGFYDKMGGKIIGKIESKVSGRFLDTYEYDF